MKKNVTLVLIGLLMGIGVGALATRQVRAQAPPPAGPALRWEQDCEPTRNIDEARSVARNRGDAGWELAALDAGIMCFKRPVRPVARAAEPWPGY